MSQSSIETRETLLAAAESEMSTQMATNSSGDYQPMNESVNGSMISLINGNNNGDVQHSAAASNGGLSHGGGSNGTTTSASASSSVSASAAAGKKTAEWVRLNIGGQYFVTTKTTLCRNAHSFFFKLLQDDPSVGLVTDKDETGAYLIDRDPQYFAPILNYLRHGKLVIENNLQEEGVLEEAEFYNLHELIHLVKERIRDRDDRRNSQNVKRVYRVIQFKETEITQMLSTMSDGWKFEQIVNVGSHYNYTNDDHSEYLLIVSKEYGVNDHINETESSDKRKKIVQQHA